MYLRALCANKYILSALLFTFCSPLLILQQVMITKGGEVAPQSRNALLCSLAVSDIALCFYVSLWRGCSAEHCLKWKLHFIFLSSVILSRCLKSILAFLCGSMIIHAVPIFTWRKTTQTLILDSVAVLKGRTNLPQIIGMLSKQFSVIADSVMFGTCTVSLKHDWQSAASMMIAQM